MRTWEDLQVILQGVLGDDGVAYYQPPENLKLKYPCIVFERSNSRIRHANNLPYQITKRYTATLITKDADNDLYLDRLLMLPMCRHDRHMIREGLVHEYFDIYY